LESGNVTPRTQRQSVIYAFNIAAYSFFVKNALTALQRSQRSQLFLITKYEESKEKSENEMVM
jgi:hypothetical protein